MAPKAFVALLAVVTASIMGLAQTQDKKSISGTLERVDTGKKQITFWYSLGDGIGKKGELNRKLEVLVIAKDCKVTLNDKTDKLTSLSPGHQVSILHKDGVA